MVASGSNPNPDKDRPSTSPSPPDTERARRPQILVVEDNKADIFLIRDAITVAKVDADFHILHDGNSARRFFEIVDRDATAPAPDLVLLDLNLPRSSGEEVLAYLRTTARYRNTPVLVVTSSDSARDREKVAQFDVVGYFRKPSEYAEFLKLGLLVKSLLEPIEPASPAN